MVPLETATQDEEAEGAAAAAFGFYRSVYACPQCGERVTVALLHEQWPRHEVSWRSTGACARTGRAVLSRVHFVDGGIGLPVSLARGAGSPTLGRDASA